MENHQPSRVEAYAQWATIVLALLGGLFTTWGKIERLEQRLDDSETQRTQMEQTLERIEARLYTIGK